MATKQSDPKPVRDRQYFSEQIQIRWNKARKTILEVGRLIVEARQTLSQDEYAKFVNVDLPFNYSTLQKLRTLAESERINDPRNKDLLPHSWNTLYEIIHLSDEAFEAGVERKIITPESSWKEIKALRDEFDPELKLKRAQIAVSKVHGSGLRALRQRATTSHRVAEAPSERVVPTPKAPSNGVVVHEARPIDSDEAVSSIVIASSGGPQLQAASVAPQLESAPNRVPVLNRLVAYVTGDIPEDDRNALLADLRQVKSKHAFIEAIQVLVLEREQ